MGKIKLLGMTKPTYSDYSSTSAEMTVKYREGFKIKYVDMLYVKDRNILAYLQRAGSQNPIDKEQSRRLILDILNILENTPTQEKLMKQWVEQDNKEKEQAKEKQKKIQEKEEQIRQIEKEINTIEGEH